jgi:3-deoxy-D-manno-octulosonic-acid transferase
MNKNNSIVAIYPSHTAAEAAIKELQQSGFDMKKLSIVGRGYHTDEHAEFRDTLARFKAQKTRCPLFQIPRHTRGSWLAPDENVA